MENALSPAFVRIDYTSIYAPHSMEIPSVAVGLTDGADSPYEFLLPTPLAPIEVEEAVTAYVNIIKAFFIPSTVFNGYTLFTQADENSPAVPVETNSLNIVGTAGTTSWEKAVQWTVTWRTTAFGVFKVVFLDAISNNDFDKITNEADDVGLDPVHDYVTNTGTWVRGRDGGKPKTFLQASKTLNEKLRRSYKMN